MGMMMRMARKKMKPEIEVEIDMEMSEVNVEMCGKSQRGYNQMVRRMSFYCLFVYQTQ